jgi:hypothetical protein
MFEEITVRNRSPNLFQTMIPEIEDGMKGNLDNFNNDLELITINLCSKKSQNIKYFFKSIFLDSLKEIFCKSISWVLLTVFFIVVALLKFS